MIWACLRGFLLELFCCRSSLSGLHSFSRLFAWHGKCFAELAWLIFLLGVGLVQFLLELLHCRNLLLVFRSFLFVWRRWGKCFVELAWLNFLLNVGLAQFFGGVLLSEFPVGLSRRFFSGGGGNIHFFGWRWACAVFLLELRCLGFLLLGFRGK